MAKGAFSCCLLSIGKLTSKRRKAGVCLVIPRRMRRDQDPNQNQNQSRNPKREKDDVIASLREVISSPQPKSLYDRTHLARQCDDDEKSKSAGEI
jgi:hypothetical protein